MNRILAKQKEINSGRKYRIWEEGGMDDSCYVGQRSLLLRKQVSSFLIRTHCSHTAFNPIRFYPLLTLQQGIKSEAPFSLTSPIPAWLESVFNSSWALAFPIHSVATPPCLIIFTNDSVLTNRLHYPIWCSQLSTVKLGHLILEANGEGGDNSTKTLSLSILSLCCDLSLRTWQVTSRHRTALATVGLPELLARHLELLLDHNDQQPSYLLHLYRSLPVGEILKGCATRSYAWSRHWNNSSIWQQTMEKWMLTQVPFLRKPVLAHPHTLFC